MIDIRFRGKSITESKARSLISKLKSGEMKPYLTLREKETYEIFKDCNIHDWLKKPENEKDFLINEIEKSINIHEFSKKIDYCEKNGHTEKKGSRYISSGKSGTKIYSECSHCGMNYNRPLNTEELKRHNDLIDLQVKL